jgi:hypothetical protein
MATLGTMKTRIANEIARADLTTEIAESIVSAIAHHDTGSWWFNETSGTFSTSSGTDEYAPATATFLTSLIREDAITATVQGSRDPLRRISWEQMVDQRWDSTPSGPPMQFAIYGQKFYVYPVPNATYTITIWYAGILGVPGADGSTNAWTTEGEALIRARAKMLLFRDVIRDANEAAVQANAEADALVALRRMNNARIATGRVDAEYL